MPDLPNKHSFGGDWTEQKLRIIENYLRAYTTVMKNQSFRTSYIDAFAGTGYRTSRSGTMAESIDPLLLPELAEREPQRLLEGSVLRALRTRPPFDDFTFIEKDKSKHEALMRIKDDFPQQASRINIVRDDANSAIARLCSEHWRSRRAVLFLDPYGMQVDWSTTVAIAETSAIDLWCDLHPQTETEKLVTALREGDRRWERGRTGSSAESSSWQRWGGCRQGSRRRRCSVSWA